MFNEFMIQTRSDILQGQALFRGVKQLLTRAIEKNDGQKTVRKRDRQKEKRQKEKQRKGHTDQKKKNDREIKRISRRQKEKK